MIIMIKRCLCILLTTIFFIILPMNRYLSIKAFADDSIATQNPLFIPITTFVTAGLIGSGMIAKNSQEALNAGGQLVNNIISQIKSSEVAKSESDSTYDSPYRVINGGQPEKPNSDNKNGKWVAVAGGALASNEIYANKEAIQDIMSKANNLGGYNQSTVESGVVSIADSKILSVANASGIALQLANFSNRLVTQFNEIIHSSAYSDWVSASNIDESHVVYSVIFNVQSLLSKNDNYPAMSVSAIDLTNVENISLQYQMIQEVFNQEETSTYYSGSYVFDTPNPYLGSQTDSYWTYGICKLLNVDSVAFKRPYAYFRIGSRTAEQSASVSKYSSSTSEIFRAYDSSKINVNKRGYAGFKWLNVNPIQFTNNVYNVNMTFDENFENWVQGQIEGLSGQIIEAVRLGLTSSSVSWNPSQEQIQEGTSPSSVIYQFINNYENPENIPDDDEEEDQPVVVPPAIEEPQPNNDYLGNFLLPESITTKFPFCIPFDIARAMRLFSTSSREAPKWEFDLTYGTQSTHIVIDLAIFDDLASFLRPLEYILFLVGLAYGTRSLIRG